MATPPERPILRERYEHRRREVIDIAAHVFAEQGYHATSVPQLVEATGLTSGGLYHYIGSKEALLVRICDELIDPLVEEARAIVARREPPEAELRALVHAWVSHIEHHLDHMLVFQQERNLVTDDPDWQAVLAKRKAFERIIDRTLERGEREGAFDIPDRRLALLALLGMVNYTPQWFRPRGRLSATEIADGYCDMLLAAWGAGG